MRRLSRAAAGCGLVSLLLVAAACGRAEVREPATETGPEAAMADAAAGEPGAEPTGPAAGGRTGAGPTEPAAGPRLVALRDSFRRRVAADSLLRRIAADSGDVLIGMRTDLVRQIAAWMSGSYLDRVSLHLAPDLVVQHEEDVKVKVGPLRVRAGEWRVRVRVRSIRAALRVGAVGIEVADSTLLRATVAVASDGGTGEVTIDFAWDAAAVPSLVCDDFEVREDFSGTLPAERYRVRGVLRLLGSPEGVVAVPDFSKSPIRVRPRPTPESWGRIRAILEEAEEGCGPLDPDDIVQKLGDVFARGFEFELPESIFRPVRLPTRISERVTVAGSDVQVRASPVGLRVSEGAIWYGTRLEVAPGGTVPVAGGR